MNQILFLGYSSIVQRRVIPAILNSKHIDQFEIASRRGIMSDWKDYAKYTRGYEGFESALQESNCPWVYISTINREHKFWAERALRSGKNVIVDKPSFLEASAAKELSSLAAKNNLSIVESTVYFCHTQFDQIKKLFSNGILRISAQFSIPPLPLDNFRMQPKPGGGALYDMGPYAISVGSEMFGTRPVRILATANQNKKGIVTSFSCMMDFGKSRSMVGQFGFDTTYVNRVEVWNDTSWASMDRFFTTPGNFSNTLFVRSQGEELKINIEASDPFQNFLDSVLINPKSWAEKLIPRAQDLETLIQSAGVKP